MTKTHYMTTHEEMQMTWMITFDGTDFFVFTWHNPKAILHPAWLKVRTKEKLDHDMPLMIDFIHRIAGVPLMEIRMIHDQVLMFRPDPIQHVKVKMVMMGREEPEYDK